MRTYTIQVYRILADATPADRPRYVEDRKVRAKSHEAARDAARGVLAGYGRVRSISFARVRGGELGLIAYVTDKRVPPPARVRARR